MKLYAAAVFAVGGALPAKDVIVVLRLRHPLGYGPTRVNPSKRFHYFLTDGRRRAVVGDAAGA
jgi:hypothetical protein